MLVFLDGPGCVIPPIRFHPRTMTGATLVHLLLFDGRPYAALRSLKAAKLLQLISLYKLLQRAKKINARSRSASKLAAQKSLIRWPYSRCRGGLKSVREAPDDKTKFRAN